jgi:hypothetical protein
VARLQIRSNLIIITSLLADRSRERRAEREESDEMPIEFYDVKKREKVQIPESEVTKTTYERQGKDGTTQVRYAFKAVNEGTKLTKFASKEDWDALDAPVE